MQIILYYREQKYVQQQICDSNLQNNIKNKIELDKFCPITQPRTVQQLSDFRLCPGFDLTGSSVLEFLPGRDDHSETFLICFIF